MREVDVPATLTRINQEQMDGEGDDDSGYILSWYLIFRENKRCAGRDDRSLYTISSRLQSCERTRLRSAKTSGKEGTDPSI